jgi:poly(A) polymerase
MADAGLLGPLLAGVPLVAQFERLAAIEAALAMAPDAIRRLGALALHVREDAERLWQRLRLSNSEHERLAAMADQWWRVGADLGERAARVLLYRLRHQSFADHVLLAWARSGADPSDPAWRQFLALPQRWSPPRFPLRAADFVARGLQPGPRLGQALARAQAAWIAADFPADPAALAVIADAAAETARG